MAKAGPKEMLLEEGFLRKLEQLRLLSQQNARGGLVGEHLTRKSGASLEFLDYRNYEAGDDLRYVDWNVFGRLDRLFIKLFHAERDRTIHVLLDTSQSMEFGSPSKSLAAKKIVAALSYIGLANHDQVGLTSFADSIKVQKAPEKGRPFYRSILQDLQDLTVEGGTDFNKALEDYARGSKRPGAAIILSDLLDPKGIEGGLKALKYAKFDATVIQILDHEELYPQKKGFFQMKDVETGALKSIPVTHQLLENYHKKMESFLAQIKSFCLRNQVDYHLFDTKLPFEDFLLRYLSAGKLVQ